MIIYESKTVKVEVKENGILVVEDSGRRLNIDLKIYSNRKDVDNDQN